MVGIGLGSRDEATNRQREDERSEREKPKAGLHSNETLERGQETLKDIKRGPFVEIVEDETSRHQEDERQPLSNKGDCCGMSAWDDIDAVVGDLWDVLEITTRTRVRLRMATWTPTRPIPDSSRNVFEILRRDLKVQ